MTIPVVLKASADRTERKRVGFIVETDDKEHPALQYAVSAALYPDLEILTVGEGPRVLRAGKPGRWEFVVAARRVGDDGAELPDKVEAESPLSARFAGPPKHDDDPDGLTSDSRTIEVVAPASSAMGSHVASIVLKRGKNEAKRWLVVWQVEPAVRVTPKSLILKPDEISATHRVVVYSEDRPIRILGVGPSELLSKVEFGKESSERQTVALVVDRRRSGVKEFTVVIRTDHPDHPTVALAVLFLPKGM